MRYCDYNIRLIYLQLDILNAEDINKHRNVQQSNYMFNLCTTNPLEKKTFNYGNCGERVDHFGLNIVLLHEIRSLYTLLAWLTSKDMSL